MPHPRDHIESNTAQELINPNKKVSLITKTIKAGFHIITMIAAIAGRNAQLIVVIIWVPQLSDRS